MTHYVKFDFQDQYENVIVRFSEHLDSIELNKIQEKIKSLDKNILFDSP